MADKENTSQNSKETGYRLFSVNDRKINITTSIIIMVYPIILYQYIGMYNNNSIGIIEAISILYLIPYTTVYLLYKFVTVTLLRKSFKSRNADKGDVLRINHKEIPVRNIIAARVSWLNKVTILFRENNSEKEESVNTFFFHMNDSRTAEEINQRIRESNP